MTDRCCDDLERHLDGWSCGQHDEGCACPAALLVQGSDDGPVGIIVHDGGSAAVLIRHCPWCGTAVTS